MGSEMCIRDRYHLFTEHVDDGTASVIYSPESVDLADEVNFMKTMPDGEILFSVEPNQLVGLRGNTMVTYDYGLEGEAFTVLDVAEYENQEATQRLMLTKEGNANSFRGVVGMAPTAPMSTSSGSNGMRLKHTPKASGWASGRTSAHRVLTVQVQQRLTQDRCSVGSLGTVMKQHPFFEMFRCLAPVCSTPLRHLERI